MAQAIVLGSVPPDANNSNANPAAAKSGMGRMLTAQGNDYMKLQKPDEATAAFKQAAEISPQPAVAYYNLCAMEFNAGKFQDAAAACDKSTAADPSKADPWFFKGAALYQTGKVEGGKRTVPPGTVEALNKYLQLAPNGARVAQVKVMLQAMGEK